MANNLVNEPVPLVKAYKKLDPDTIQHCSQIITDARVNPDLLFSVPEEFPSMSYIPADFPLYRKGGILNLASLDNNPFFLNIDDAIEQMSSISRIFVPREVYVGRITAADTTLEIKLLELEPKPGKDVGMPNLAPYLGVFLIPTDKYDNLNKTQRKLAERICGEGDAFQQNMELFRRYNIENIPVCALTPEFIDKFFERNKECEAFSRPCSLSYHKFTNSVSVTLGIEYINVPYLHLRGMPKTR